MRFSIWPSATQPWTDMLEVARHAEETGWDGVWIADHFMGSGTGAARVG
jgi:alkanesulfonate monooxygenase SsuD/methylene tetrahydromethanopterin reductase-like flavin-dependent oxidoreductase (luciferase family)